MINVKERGGLKMIVEKTICDECGEEAYEKGRVDISWYCIDLCEECKKKFDRITKAFNERMDEIGKEEKQAMQKELPRIAEKIYGKEKSV